MGFANSGWGKGCKVCNLFFESCAGGTENEAGKVALQWLPTRHFGKKALEDLSIQSCTNSDQARIRHMCICPTNTLITA